MALVYCLPDSRVQLSSLILIRLLSLHVQSCHFPFEAHLLVLWLWKFTIICFPSPRLDMLWTPQILRVWVLQWKDCFIYSHFFLKSRDRDKPSTRSCIHCFIPPNSYNSQGLEKLKWNSRNSVWRPLARSWLWSSQDTKSIWDAGTTSNGSIDLLWKSSCNMPAFFFF